MATKLSKQQLERLKSIGIVVKTGTLEEATKNVLAFLTKNDLTGVEGSPLEELIEMAEVFYEPAANEAPEEEEEVEEEEEAEEVEEEETEEEEEEAEEEEADEEEELDELAEEVTEEEEVEEEETEEEEEEAAPVKKAPVKAAPVDKKVVVTPAPVKKAAPSTTPAKKAVVPPAPVAPVKKGGIAQADGERFDARKDPKHMAYIKPFMKFFPAADFAIDILKQGFTVRSLGSNAKITVMNYDELRIVGGKLIGNLYANRFESAEDLMTVLSEEHHDREIGMFRGESHPSIKRFTQDELIDLLGNTTFLATSLERAGKKDTRMGANRQKLEENMKASKPAPVVKKVAGKEEPKAAAFNKTTTSEYKAEGTATRKAAATAKATPVAPVKKAAPAPVSTEPVVINTKDLGDGLVEKTFKNPDGTTFKKKFRRKA